MAHYCGTKQTQKLKKKLNKIQPNKKYIGHIHANHHLTQNSCIISHSIVPHCCHMKSFCACLILQKLSVMSYTVHCFCGFWMQFCVKTLVGPIKYWKNVLNIMAKMTSFVTLEMEGQVECIAFWMNYFMHCCILNISGNELESEIVRNS